MVFRKRGVYRLRMVGTCTYKGMRKPWAYNHCLICIISTNVDASWLPCKAKLNQVIVEFVHSSGIKLVRIKNKVSVCEV